MKVKLITVCAIAAAALAVIPVPYGDSERVQPAPAAPAVERVEAPVGKVIAAQGNEALRQIRADVARVAPPDLQQYAIEGRPE